MIFRAVFSIEVWILLNGHQRRPSPPKISDYIFQMFHPHRALFGIFRKELFDNTILRFQHESTLAHLGYKHSFEVNLFFEEILFLTREALSLVGDNKHIVEEEQMHEIR